MKIVLDSNVWEKVIESEAEPYQTINEKIRAKVLVPYICEVALSLESIRKLHRAVFFETYKPQVIFEDLPSERNSIRGRVCFAPNCEAHPGLPEVLMRRLGLAQRLGFQVIRMNRFGTVRTNEVPKEMYEEIQSKEEFWTRCALFEACVSFIETMGCGQLLYNRLKQEFGLQGGSLASLAGRIPASKIKTFAKAIGEWSDGDSLAACYSSGIHLFCTDDGARNAGKSSVLFPENIAKLSRRFNIDVVSSASAVEL